MRIHFYEPAALPEIWRDFWKVRVLSRRPHRALTGGPAWFGMMAQIFGGCVLCAEDDAGRPRVLVPLVCSAPPRIGRWKIAQRGSWWNVGGGDLIAEDVSAEDLSEVWRTIFERNPACAGIRFETLTAGALSESVRRSVRMTPGLFWCPLYSGLPHYRLRFGSGGDQGGLWRSGRTLRKLRNRARALERATGAALHVLELTTCAEMVAHRQDWENLMARRWQTRRLGAAFHLEDVEPVAARGWLRSFLLMAGSRPVAGVVGYQGEGVYVYEEVGYDPELARYSPGTLLLFRLLDILSRRDPPQWLDFGEGAADYKAAWATEEDRVDGGLIVRFSFPFWFACRTARLASMATALARRLAGAALPRTVRQRGLTGADGEAQG